MSSSKATRISLSPPSTNPSSASSNDRSSRQLNKVSYKRDDNSTNSDDSSKEDDNDYYDDDDDESVSREAPTTKKKKKKKNSKKKNIPTTEPNFPPPTTLPSHFEMRTIEKAIGKSDEFVWRTEKFIKTDYNKFNDAIKPLAKEFTRDMWPIISGLCTVDDTGNSFYPVDGMVSPESELLGIYILWMHEKNQWKAGCVTGKSRDLITRTAEQIDPQWDVTKYALIAMTLPKLRELADDNSIIWDYVHKFINAAKSFNVYEDHEEDNKDEVLIFLMEHTISCCLEGVDPGYILERFIKNGSPDLTKYLSSCSERNQTVAEALSILTQANSHCTTIQTWETYAAATRDGMLEVLNNKLNMEGCRPESILQLEALMEALFPLLHRKGKYMKRQVGLNYLWNGAVLPIDIIDALYCPIYADVEKLAREVTALMGRIDDDYDGTFDKIRALFETFTSKHKKRYVPPDREGDIYLGAIKKVLADALDSARESDYTQELIEGEAHMLDLLSDEDRNYYLSGEELSVVNPMGEVAGTLYKTTHGEDVKKTIMIFVTEFSPFAPYQPTARFIARARGVSKQLAVADTRAAAGLIQKAAVAKFRSMMSSTLINIEPPKYDYTAAPKLDDDILEEEMFENEDEDEEEEDSEVTFAISGIRKAFPLGYLDPSKSVGIGVAALASIIHPGMLDLHAAALMAAMETHHLRFATFLLKYCQIDINPPPDGMHSKEDLVHFFQSMFIKSRILWGIEQTRRIANALPDDPDEEELGDAARAIIELEDDKRMKADVGKRIREFCGDDEIRAFNMKYAVKVLLKGADDVLAAKVRTLFKAYELEIYYKYEDEQGFRGGLAGLNDLCDDDFDRF